eukprot:gene12125-13377_t
MKLVHTFLVALFCATSVLSQFPVTKHLPGHCSMYSQCGGFSPPRNCFDNKPARVSGDPDYISLLKNTCPQFVHQNGTNTYSLACCDILQLKTLSTQLQAARNLLQRCPACLKNFINLWCEFTCSNDQALFTSVSTYGLPYTMSVDYYITPQFAEGLFNSCRNVNFPGSNGKVLDLMCGTSADKCTPQKWLDFVGRPPQAPFSIVTYQMVKPINPNITGDIVIPSDAHMIGCNETFYDASTNSNSSACSCQDCIQSCPVPPAPPAKKKMKYIGILPESSFIVLIIYLVFAVTFVIFCCVTMVFKKGRSLSVSLNNYEQFDEPFTSQQDQQAASYGRKEQGCFVRFGARMEKHVITNPVDLWSAPKSEARIERDYFDKTFGPFYRTEQVIITAEPHNETYLLYPKDEPIHFDGILHKDMLHKVLDLQLAIMNIQGRLTENGQNRTVGLSDICFKPMSPENDDCTILSILQYWQNNHTKIDECKTDVKTVCGDGGFNASDWHDHFMHCTASPTSINDGNFLYMPCMGQFGGPVNPDTALGGFEPGKYRSAKSIILTFVVKNHDDEAKNKDAEAWEKAFIEFMKDFKANGPKDFNVSFSSERSIQDELNRESKSDIMTIVVSYLIMFLYISLALGQYNSCSKFFVDTKIVVGLCGVLIVLCSVASSLGTFSYAGVPATLIIIEVVPFLVLAVGVDNIFILVQTFQRDIRLPMEQIPDQVGRVLGQVAPSMLLSSLAESVAFGLGAMSTMPAVRVFSQYAALAVFFDFLLQITAFVALLSLDAKRKSNQRLDLCCCVRLPKTSKTDEHHNEGLLYLFMKKLYAPFLMLPPVRVSVVLVFTAILSFSICCIPFVDVGLDQKLALPKDSFLLDWFDDMNKYLHIGPPVYFVVKDGYTYENKLQQNKVCGVAGCDVNSLVQQVFESSEISSYSKIALTASSWLDDYLAWVDPSGNVPCCRKLDYISYNVTIGNHTEERRDYTHGFEFCSSSVTNASWHCSPCRPRSEKGQRPSREDFRKFLSSFLKDNPNTVCAKGGHPSYGSAVVLNPNTSTNIVKSSYFMSYHSILKTSNDYTNALKYAREMAKNMTKELDNQVFPYSIFYVFYEQYLTIVHDTWVDLTICASAIFAVTFVLLGFNFGIAFIVTFVVAMIVVDMFGLMYLWGISLNAVSLVNLIMCIGISVEFCAHIARSFSVSPLATRVDRARDALARMGSSVLSGITFTKFSGIVVLAFSKSQLFEIFYFRMYLGIVLIGAAHGLIFLPVLLSFIGPSSRAMPPGTPPSLPEPREQ